jgi:multiple sugar transport system ATP-binding protein
VEVVEPMGSEIYLTLKRNGHEIIARVETESNADVDDLVKLGVDTKNMHIFDKKTEEAIF